MKYLKSILSLIIFILLVNFLFVTKVEAAKLKLDPSSKTVGKGESFDVKIVLDLGSGEKTDGVDAILSYDKSKLEVTKITNGYFGSYPKKSYEDGEITIGATNPEAISEDGTVATITFKATNTGTAAVNFDYTQGSTVDSNVAEAGTGDDLLNGYSDGSYTISNSSSADTGGGSSTPSMPKSGNVENTIILLLGGVVFLYAGLRLKKVIT